MQGYLFLTCAFLYDQQKIHCKNKSSQAVTVDAFAQQYGRLLGLGSKMNHKGLNIKHTGAFLFNFVIVLVVLCPS